MIPRHQAVKAHVLDLIGTGALKPEDRVPSEAALVEALGVSRMTVNKALNALKDEGILTRIAGVGTFVADQRARGDLLTLRDIATELAERGHRHDMQVLKSASEAASKDAAAQFEIEPGTPLFHVMVRHLQDGRPVLIEDRLIDPAIAPGVKRADFSRTTTHAWLSAAAPLQEAEHTVRAVSADAKTARLLDLPMKAACLQVRRRTWSRGRVASVALLTYAGDRYEISGRLDAPASV